VGVAVDGHGGNIGFSNKEFMNSALGKATAKAVTNLVAEIATVSLPESGRSRNKAAAANKQKVETQAASDALKQTAGKVLAVVDKSTLVVSLGSKHGFKSGDKLDVYAVIETKDEKGEVVFSEEKLAGELTLQAVQEERSKGSYAGSNDPKAGWTVKVR
jgi:hypothetical protein